MLFSLAYTFFCRSCYEVSNCKIGDSILEASQNEDAQQQVVNKTSDNTIKQIDFETLLPMTVEPTGNTNELNEVHTSALNVLCPRIQSQRIPQLLLQAIIWLIHRSH